MNIQEQIKAYITSLPFVRNRTDIASNLNRFEQSVCELQATHLRMDSRAAANTKIKRNFKNGGIDGNLNSVASNKQ